MLPRPDVQHYRSREDKLGWVEPARGRIEYWAHKACIAERKLDNCLFCPACKTSFKIALSFHDARQGQGLQPTDVAESNSKYRGGLKKVTCIQCGYEILLAKCYCCGFLLPLENATTQEITVGYYDTGYGVYSWHSSCSVEDQQAFRRIADKATMQVKKTEEEERRGDACFIATAAYGSTTHPNVVCLREFRDKVLLRHSLGKGLVKAYYILSPPLARLISRNDGLRKSVIHLLLKPAIFLLKKSP